MRRAPTPTSRAGRPSAASCSSPEDRRTHAPPAPSTTPRFRQPGLTKKAVNVRLTHDPHTDPAGAHRQRPGRCPGRRRPGPAVAGLEGRGRSGADRRLPARPFRRPVPPERALLVRDQRRPRGQQASGAQAVLLRRPEVRAIHRCVPAASWRTQRRRPRRLGHGFVGTEHLLLALLEVPEGLRRTGSRGRRRHTGRRRDAGPGAHQAGDAGPRGASSPSRREPRRPCAARWKRHCDWATTTSGPSICSSVCSRTGSRSRRKVLSEAGGDRGRHRARTDDALREHEHADPAAARAASLPRHPERTERSD